jgi:hypothetical protein
LPFLVLVKSFKQFIYNEIGSGEKEQKLMERANVIKEEMTEKETRFLAVYVEAKNSCLVLLSENEDKLGTLALAVPKSNDSLGLMASSSILVGNRNEISARMFAEYVATKKGKIAMVSVYLDKLTEMDAQAYFKKLIEKVLAPEKKEKETQKA